VLILTPQSDLPKRKGRLPNLMCMDPKIQAHANILELIGNTPLVKINSLTSDLPGEYYAKLEAFNPGHSSKDRIAAHIIEQAEGRGILKPGSTIIETTSGNTGFSLAMVSIIKGYKCILAVSSKSSADKIDMLRTMGAKVYVCPAHVSADDPRSYYEVAKRLHNEIKDSVYINQYFNQLNIDAHYTTTGPEIWEQTGGQLTHLIACSGTGGTISGTARFLKEQNPDIRIIGVDAYGSVLKKYHETREFDRDEIYPYRIEGLGKNLIPDATDFEIIDKFVKVTDEASAHMAREICKKEGIFAGYTSGAAMQALKQLGASGEFGSSSRVVIIFPDHGSRYMSKIYSDQWMEDQGFSEPTHVEEFQQMEIVNKTL
jgi:cystathionine beta-synthase